MMLEDQNQNQPKILILKLNLPNKFNQYFTNIDKKMKDYILCDNRNIFEFFSPPIKNSIFNFYT